MDELKDFTDKEIAEFTPLILSKYDLFSKYTKKKIASAGRLPWSHVESLVQYKGFTCRLEFDWRAVDGMIITSSVSLKKIEVAPDESEQYDIE